MMMKKAFLNTSADRVSGYVFSLLGFLVILGSWRMPDFADQGASWYEAPGLTPGLLGIALLVCGVLLIMRKPPEAAAQNEAADEQEPMLGLLKDPFCRNRVLITGAFCIGYSQILVGWLPFWLATAVFIFSFICTFEFERGLARSVALRRMAIALIIAVCASAAITLVFQELFLVRLP